MGVEGFVKKKRIEVLVGSCVFARSAETATIIE